MSKSKQYRSRVLASVHETAEGLTAAGVMNKQTMREFDELCLTPVRPLTPEEIRDLREREGASQAVFARYLNVTTGLVSQWERGEKRPQGASLKLLSLVARSGLTAVAGSRWRRTSELPPVSRCPARASRCGTARVRPRPRDRVAGRPSRSWRPATVSPAVVGRAAACAKWRARPSRRRRAPPPARRPCRSGSAP